MMFRRLTTATSFLAALAASLAVAPAAAQQAGVSAAVRGQVALNRPTAAVVGRQVQSGDPIFLGDAIVSRANSGMQVMLLDETVFTIGPNSEISIDEFVYDPATSAGKVTASVTKGVFRFITGKVAQQRPENMTVKLPTATIGIRGTIVAGAVRSAAGSDAQVDAVFERLAPDVPAAATASEFVVLVGPGERNNTGDRRGAVRIALDGARAERGQNAGSPLHPEGQVAQASQLAQAGPGVDILRTGFAVVVDASTGAISPPFQAPPGATQAVTGALGGQVGDQGTEQGGETATEASQSDSGTAREASGQTIQETVGLSTAAAESLQVGESAENVGDPSETPTFAEAASFIDVAELRAISSGSGSTGFINVAQGGLSYTFDLIIDFSGQFFQFQYQNVNQAGGPSGGQVSGSRSYANESGTAHFDNSDVSFSSGCDNCNINGGFTAVDQVFFQLEHNGVTASGTASVN